MSNDNAVAEKANDTNPVPVRVKKGKTKKLGDSLVQNIGGGKKVNSPSSDFDTHEDFDLLNSDLKEPIKMTKPKAKKVKTNKQRKSLSIIGLFGFLVASAAFVGVYLNHGSVNSFKEQFKESLESNTSLVGNLTSRLDAMTAEAAKYKRVAEANSQEIERLSEYKERIETVDQTIATIKKGFVKLGGDIKLHGVKIQENNERIVKLQDSLKKRPNPTPKKSNPVMRRQTNKVYQLENATLVSIDSWGSAINAVLREEGSWIPLSVGEMYQGWRFVGSQNNQAHFAKGKKIIKLSIKE